MTTEYSLTDLTQILSALDGQKRNPCTKKAAIKAINKKAETLGIDPVDVFGAAFTIEPVRVRGRDRWVVVPAL